MAGAAQGVGLSVAQTAYLFATGVHESTGFTDFYENAPPNTGEYDYFESTYGYQTGKGSELGNTEQGQGWLYRGTGIIQTTGYNNFKRASDKFEVDLVNNPGLLASDIILSASVAALGIRDGWFGNKISKHINSNGNDFSNARKSVNSKDSKYKQSIADRANKYLGISRKCQPK